MSTNTIPTCNKTKRLILQSARVILLFILVVQFVMVGVVNQSIFAAKRQTSFFSIQNAQALSFLSSSGAAMG